MSSIANPLTSLTSPQPSASSSQTAASPSAPATDPLASESTFLTLLVSQLQNQDPLSPTDSNQFVSQLTSYSQLEQLIGIHQNTATMAAAGGTTPTSQAAGAASNTTTSTTGN
jgi:flagellar basal-body rod modification protein FlgD